METPKPAATLRERQGRAFQAILARMLRVVGHLRRLAQGVRLLGAEVMLTGIRAEVAQTLVTLGVSLGGIKTAASLQAGILQVSGELRHGL